MKTLQHIGEQPPLPNVNMALLLVLPVTIKDVWYASHESVIQLERRLLVKKGFPD